MTKIIAISGSGIGSGKTTCARRLTDIVIGFADIIRMDLLREYPEIDFFNKTQEYKNKLVGDIGKTVRQIMVDYANMRRGQDKDYFVKRTIEVIDGMYFNKVVALDDMRFVNEIKMLRSHFEDVTHFHIVWPLAVKETHTDDDKLSEIADYIIVRRS